VVVLKTSDSITAEAVDDGDSNTTIAIAECPEIGRPTPRFLALAKVSA
jgi:hypothetical protein